MVARRGERGEGVCIRAGGVRAPLSAGPGEVRLSLVNTRGAPLFAADYPFLDIFWTMLVFFMWVIWFWILITVLIDLFGRHDISGWAKAAWALFVIVLPYLGVLVYLIAQGKGMAERRSAQVRASEAAFDARVRSVSASGGADSAADQIHKAKQLLDSGAISQAEFDQIKAKALA
jgi:hypothetical protein